MNDQTLFLGKLLGEVYRTQKQLGMNVPVSSGQIYGLLNGFESVIDEQINAAEQISAEKVEAVAKVLDEYFIDDQKLANFKGFYDIENKLSELGVDRGDALVIIKYFKANEQFERVIEKMDSEHSPLECRSFKLYDYEK